MHTLSKHRRALIESVRHWEENIRNIPRYLQETETGLFDKVHLGDLNSWLRQSTSWGGIYSSTCPLCQLYFRGHKCDGCPLAVYAEKTCDDETSPWGSMVRAGTYEEFMVRANVMLNILKELLREGTTDEGGCTVG